MKKIGNILLAVIIVVTYFGIGWVAGTWYHDNVFTKTKSELIGLAKVAAGADGFFAAETKEKAKYYVENRTKEEGCVILSLLWPFFLVIFILSWVFYWVVYILYLILCGGIVKIIGVV